MFYVQGPQPGVSQFAVVYTLMKQAKQLKAFKIAKHALNLLQNLKIPHQFQVRWCSYFTNCLLDFQRCFQVTVQKSPD